MKNIQITPNLLTEHCIYHILKNILLITHTQFSVHHRNFQCLSVLWHQWHQPPINYFFFQGEAI